MNRPDSPNFYWELAPFPDRRSAIRIDMDGARSWSVYPSPAVAHSAGQDLSADQWRLKLGGSALENTSQELLHRAQQQYAESHKGRLSDAEATDDAIVLGNFYYHEYEVLADEMHKLRGFPYPVLLVLAHRFDEIKSNLNDVQPLNPFIRGPIELHNVVWRFGYTDRQLAALTAVEAIRLYAADHEFRLPSRLQDIIDTPVPDNPVTGAPFEYALENEIAIVSDPHSEEPLKYTISIRH
jgi:hypothetical protein